MKPLLFVLVVLAGRDELNASEDDQRRAMHLASVSKCVLDCGDIGLQFGGLAMWTGRGDQCLCSPTPVVDGGAR